MDIFQASAILLSGINILIISQLEIASSIDRLIRSSSLTIEILLLFPLKPTHTSNELSFKLSACARPWLPYPIIAIFFDFSIYVDTSLSKIILDLLLDFKITIFSFFN